MEQNLDEQTVRRLEEELHTEILPGTEIMADVGTHHFLKAGGRHHEVLVPTPSDDEHDPLNWSPFWKFSTMFTATLVSFVQGLGPLALAPMFPMYIKDFNSDLAAVVQFTGIAILVLGFSNFFWVPIMSCYGRRPVMIASTLICFGSAIWRAKADSYGSFMGACVLNGFAAGPAETVQPVIIADVMFLHERGFHNTLYFCAYFGSLMAGPIIAGTMAENVGWRNFWWMYVGLTGLTTLCCVFMLPETRFHRPFGYVDNKAQARDDNPASSSAEHLDESKPGAITGTASEIEKAPTLDNTMTHVPTHVDPHLGRGRPSKQQWKLWQPYTPSIFSEFLLPWRLALFPIVQLASFAVSWSASVFLTVNLTQSQVFAAPPYNFSSQTIGFFNFAPLVGAVIGLLSAGPLSDYVAALLTRRNGGVREPEFRLLAAVPYVLIMILGNVVVALGYEHQWPWEVIVLIGYTCGGIQVTSLPAIFSTYAVDSYKPVAGSIFVSITVNKNVWGYGFSRFITPWTEEVGYIIPIMTNMALATLFCGTGIVFWYWGKTFRRWTRDSSVHVERST